MKEIKNVTVYVYRDTLGDCTNNGVTAKNKNYKAKNMQRIKNLYMMM